MRSLVLAAALLGALAASPVFAQDASKPSPDDIQTVVVTGLAVPELGVPLPAAHSNAGEIRYESSLNVDGLRTTGGAAWPSTTWVIYLH